MNFFGDLGEKNRKKLLILNNQFRVILEKKLISELRVSGEAERTKFQLLTKPPVAFN
jgi:hypothetical protein